MDPDKIMSEVIITVLREGIKEGVNWLKERKGRKDEEQAPEEKAQAEPIKAKEDLDWDKVATLFWLGNDLMWTEDMMYRGAHPERVLQGIDHALQYVSELGFGDRSLPISELTLARTVIQPFEGITNIDDRIANNIRLQYKSADKNIEHVKWYLSRLAEQKEPAFSKLRAK